MSQHIYNSPIQKEGTTLSSRYNHSWWGKTGHCCYWVLPEKWENIYGCLHHSPKCPFQHDNSSWQTPTEKWGWKENQIWLKSYQHRACFFYTPVSYPQFLQQQVLQLLMYQIPQETGWTDLYQKERKIHPTRISIAMLKSILVSIHRVWDKREEEIMSRVRTPFKKKKKIV